MIFFMSKIRRASETADRIDGGQIRGADATPGEYYTAVFLKVHHEQMAIMPYHLSSEDNVTGDKKEIAEADGKKQSYQLEMIVYQ